MLAAARCSASSPTAVWDVPRPAPSAARWSPSWSRSRGDGAGQRGLRRGGARAPDPGGAADHRAASAAGWDAAPRNLSSAHGGPGPHPELLDHRPHRPREVDAGRSHPRDHPHGRPAQHARPAARLDGPRARARDHDQGPGRARVLRGAGRRDLPAAPHRHARARRLHLRGQPLAGRVRGRAAGGRRLPGRRGPDRRQHLPGGRLRARADPDAEQDRPARRRARARGRGDRRADRRGPARGQAHQRQDRRRRRRGARGARRARPAAPRRPRRAPARADLRLRVRPVPRRDRLHPGRRRHVHQGRGDRRDGGRHAGRRRRHRLLHARHDTGRCALRRRGRLPDHRDQGRRRACRSATR